ncbi:uncharacterized protein TM35_000232270 [Trypanosoma theileri]|uniref:Uncharacterized protein n=1 Tax=Trypanosoma theileri TaxID=67003 RepID=A0A1X0NRB8_9TRYP|nr:uncharacterized protein TM35_000232270 [Trypanosoma theileri]ORC87256.1 hypothetical protein TM35_000232270 [Trypanosoma theileri]
MPSRNHSTKHKTLKNQQSGQKDMVTGSSPPYAEIASPYLPSLQTHHGCGDKSTNGRTNEMGKEKQNSNLMKSRNTSTLTMESFLSPHELCFNIPSGINSFSHQFSILNSNNFYEYGFFDYGDYDTKKTDTVDTKHSITREPCDDSTWGSQPETPTDLLLSYSHSLSEFNRTPYDEPTNQSDKGDDVNIQTPLQKTISIIDYSEIYGEFGMSSTCITEVFSEPVPPPTTTGAPLTLHKYKKVEEPQFDDNDGQKTVIPQILVSEPPLRRSRGTSFSRGISTRKVTWIEPLPELKSSAPSLPKPQKKNVSQPIVSSKVPQTLPNVSDGKKKKNNFKMRRFRRYGICIETSSRSRNNRNVEFRLKLVTLILSRGNVEKEKEEEEEEEKEILRGNDDEMESLLESSVASSTVTVIHQGELQNGCLVELKADYDFDEVITSTKITRSITLTRLLQLTHCGIPTFMPITYALGCHSMATRLCRNVLRELVRRFRDGTKLDKTTCNVWISLCAVMSPSFAVDLLRHSRNHDDVVSLRNGFIAFCGPFFMDMIWMEVTSEVYFLNLEDIILREQLHKPDGLIIGTLLAREYSPGNQNKGSMETLLLPSFTFSLTSNPTVFPTISEAKASPLQFFLMSAFNEKVTTHVTCVTDNSATSYQYFEHAMNIPQTINKPLYIYDINRQFKRANKYLKGKNLSDTKDLEKSSASFSSFMKAYKSAKSMLMNPEMIPMNCMKSIFTSPLLEKPDVHKEERTLHRKRLVEVKSSHDHILETEMRLIRGKMSQHKFYKEEKRSHKLPPLVQSRSQK